MIGRRDPDAPRVPRKDRSGMNPVRVALIVSVLLIVGVVYAFTKHVPFTHGFRVQAAFTSANEIRVNSPVRIAGVNIGKVTKISRFTGGDGQGALVTMDISKAGLPIHKDATAKIRPRIFLEGNFFVDLQPGTPDAPDLGSGDTIPIAQTSTPVQLDQVLTSLQTDSREDLQKLLEGYGTALTYQPTTADDVGQDPEVKGKTAAQALNASIKTGAPALRGVSIVNEALLGLQQHDLSALVANTAKVTGALGRSPVALQDLITNFNTTMGSLAVEQSNLKQTVALLGPTLKTAHSALAHVDASLPDTRAFARELIPGVKATPATITAAYPWIAQTEKLLSEPELRGLLAQLTPGTQDLAAVATGSEQALPQADLVSQCVTNVILPTGDIKIDDGTASTESENYKEFWYSIVGLAGEGAAFDGNGHYVRFGLGGGDNVWATGKYGAEKQYARTDLPPLGTRPAYPGVAGKTPYDHKAKCKDQAVPNLNGAKVGPADGSGAGGTPNYAEPAAPAAPAAGAVGSASSAVAAKAVQRPQTVVSTLLKTLDPLAPTKAAR